MTAFGKLYACKSLNTYCLYFFSIHKYLHIRIIKASYQQYPILFHRYTAFPVGKICLLGRKLPVDLIQIRFLIGSQNCLFHAGYKDKFICTVDTIIDSRLLRSKCNDILKRFCISAATDHHRLVLCIACYICVSFV